MAHDVFISYSARDKVVADAVCATLEGRRIRCWIAPRDVLPGERWVSALIDAIGQSRVFVLVFSDGANHSPQVLREVGEAVDRGVPIIPLRIEDVHPSREIGYYIKAVHWLDALNPPLEEHLRRLADTVETLVPGLKERGIQPTGSEVKALEQQGVKAPEAITRRRAVAWPAWGPWAALLILLAVLVGGTKIWWRVQPSANPVPTQVTQGSQTAVLTATVVPTSQAVASTTTAVSSRTWTAAPTAAPTPADTPAPSPVGDMPVPAAVTKVLEPSGITLVYVSAGEFWMGSADTDTEAESDEKPQHKVSLDGYWIGQTEVTNAQYGKFIDAGGYGNLQYWSDAGWLWKEGNSISKPWLWEDSLWNGGEYPVVGVSWYEAEAYARWAGVRLPTEAEWEYAARGGPLSEGYVYAGSNDVEEVAWYGCNFGSRTHPVAQKKSNELGLYDMSGNAWEWVADWYDSEYYWRSTAQKPTGPSSGSHRALRGGSWDLSHSLVRCAFRFGVDPDYRGLNDGFRVAQ